MTPVTSPTRKLIQKLKRKITFQYYEVIYALLTPPQVNTMNYGYAPVTDGLTEHYHDSEQRYQYELYWQTFSQLDKPLNESQLVCDISCGRGGGSAFIQNITAGKVMGLERSPSARRYAKRQFGLDVHHVVAPALPLANSSVDLFLSVEAAHNYHNELFVAELSRCTKPGGLILLTDMNLGPDEHVKKKLEALYFRHGLIVESWRDIRRNVLLSLDADHSRKERFIRYLPAPFKAEARAYMGSVGSHKYNEMKRDERAYFIMKIRKPSP